MELISAILNSSEFKHDRFFNESFELPYKIDSIKIQPNELSTYRALNSSFERLYKNFLYIYSLTKLGSNVLPSDLRGTAGVLGGTFGWAPSGTNPASFSNFSTIGLSAFNDTIINEVQYSSALEQNLFVTCSLSAVILSRSDQASNTITVILSTDKVDVDQNLAFRNIVAATLYNDNLYIADSFYNNIYKYDLTGLLTDRIYPDTLVVAKAIGGTGNAEKRYKFNNIGGITIFKDRLYVLDVDNFAIKIYDTDLNFIKSIQRVDIFRDDKAKVIAGESTTNKIYVGTEGNNIVVFDQDIKNYEIVDFSKFTSSGESILNIFTSKSFNNAYSIVTNKNIWKFYASKPGNPVGKYSLYRFGIPTTETFHHGSSIAGAQPGSDDVYILSSSTSTNVRKFINAIDAESFIDVLTVNDFEVYSLDDVKLLPSEYSQTWVINKAIQKLLMNHIRLKDKIIGRFFGTFDSNNNLLVSGYLYFLLADLDLTDYSITLDHFAGNNEAYLNTVINRGLEKIYNLQELMIGKSNTIIKDSSFSENEAVFIG